MSRTSREERAAHIDLWRSSGLSRAAYCRESGLSYGSFTQWVRDAGVGRKTAATARGAPAESPEAGVGFVELPVRAKGASCGGHIQLTWQGSPLRIEVRPGCDPAWCAALIGRLQPC